VVEPVWWLSLPWWLSLITMVEPVETTCLVVELVVVVEPVETTFPC